MTLVFIIAVTSNISSWLNSTISFSSDVTILIHSLILTYSLTFGVPIVTHFGLKCVSPQIAANLETQHNLGFSHMIALHGYSVVVYLPALLICVIPSTVVRWIALTLAFGWSSTLIVRNVGLPILGGGGGMTLADHARESFSGVSLIRGDELGEGGEGGGGLATTTASGVVQGGGGRKRGVLILVWLLSCQVLFVVILEFGFYSN
jgi:hypothetical protein